MDRVLEPELMDNPDEAEAYDRMDHTQVNQKFVADLLATGPIGPDVLDLGTGTALIPVELCQQHRECRVMASDAAVSMLDLARYNVSIASLDNRIQLHYGDSKKLGFEDAMFDTVISNSLVHHIPQPRDALAEMVRVCKVGGRIFVRDLCRPGTMAEVEALVEMHSAGETEECQQLFRQSLIAALSLDEIRSLVTELGFAPETVQLTSDRHWTWSARRELNS